MTGQELRRLRDLLEWDIPQLSRAVGADVTEVENWENGSVPVPTRVARQLPPIDDVLARRETERRMSQLGIPYCVCIDPKIEIRTNRDLLREIWHPIACPTRRAFRKVFNQVRREQREQRGAHRP